MIAIIKNPETNRLVPWFAIFNVNRQCKRQQEKFTENDYDVTTKHNSFLLNSYCLYIAVKHNMYI